MDTATRKFYDAERYRVRRAALEIKRGYPMARQGQPPKPVRRSDGRVYNSVSEAAQAMGLHDGAHISAACRHRDGTAAGFGWRYLDSWEAESMDADSKVYRDVMASLWQGTCRQCKFYAKTGGREVCKRGARTMDTNATATCPRWERVPSHVEAERARLAAEAQAQRDEAIQRNREAMERKREREAEAEAYKWEFRGQVLGLQVDYLVAAICKRYDIDPGTGER